MTLISFSFFVKDSNQNLDRASGVQNRNQDVNEQFSKNEIRKLSYLELDDVLQGLGVLEVLLRGLVGVADVDVVLVEIEVEMTSYRFDVNR